MAKNYKFLVNDGTGAVPSPVAVVQGAGIRSEPVRIPVKRGWRIEVQEEAKARGLAPDQMRLKRVGKHLLIMLDGNQVADAVLEDFYAEPTDANKDVGMPRLLGRAENGALYEYIPQDPSFSSMPQALSHNNTPVIVSLGAGPIEEAFVLAAAPLIVAAAGGVGLGGAALAAGALVAAAAGGGGGGGGGGAATETAAPTVNLVEDKNNDGYINKEELAGASKLSVAVGVPAHAKTGDRIVVTDGVRTVVHTLSDEDIARKSVTLTDAFDPPREGGAITITATLGGKAGQVSATLDTLAPDNDTIDLGVQIVTDRGPGPNGDNLVNADELAGATVFVSRAVFNNQALAGYKIVFSATNGAHALPSQTVTLTPADVARGFVEVAFPIPAEGAVQTVTARYADPAGNADDTDPPTDHARLDSLAPNGGQAPVVSIESDGAAGGARDGFVNTPELEGGAVFKVKASFDPAKVAIGDMVVFTAGGLSTTLVVDAAMLNAGAGLTSFPAPGNGTRLTVTAVIKDLAHNASKAGVAEAVRNFLEAVADETSATVPTSGPPAIILGNVIANDKNPQYLADGANEALGGLEVSVTGVKPGSAGSAVAVPASGVTIAGEYGTLTIKPDGSYEYALSANPRTQALKAGEQKVDSFTYDVKDLAGNVSGATLAITVTGVNDTAEVVLKPSLILVEAHLNQVRSVNDALVVRDPDAQEAALAGVGGSASTVLNGKYGALVLSPSSISDQHAGYSYSYTKFGVLPEMPGTVRHDLFTVLSVDGTGRETFDFLLPAAGAATRQEFHTSSVTGLKISSTSSATFDTLVLNGRGIVFDFVGDVVRYDINSMEKVDITGTGDNLIRLSMDSLLQADGLNGGSLKQLFIEGNLGDRVEFNKPSDVSYQKFSDTASHPGYDLYKFADGHELFIHQAVQVYFIS